MHVDYSYWASWRSARCRHITHPPAGVNLPIRLCRVQARAFYGFQIAIENIHSGKTKPPTCNVCRAGFEVQAHHLTYLQLEGC